ncbi:hypothetical protein BI081_gp137 [Mycobacterium phage Tonenili]|uniref:Uncharacterized protein n=1 Tax=Mycobacterium phage Tonenili TaxID=1891703 RepID=A0A1C9EHJ8_9CAUD|nr:hypothetical protein BI081_gp137 [Mycobacterium phage Tonenili]AON96970.1 hypothetical protein SEA_TONENILI_252 [Mycobacterium phage Tonenili]
MTESDRVLDDAPLSSLSLVDGQPDHVPGPELTDKERVPEDVPSSGLYDAIFEGHPPRRLNQVWNQQGDVDQDAELPSDEESHERVLDRLREDPEADWRRAVSEKSVDTSVSNE